MLLKEEQQLFLLLLVMMILAFKMWRMLYDAGVFVNVFISPGVPPGRQMMRTSYMATHEDEHLDKILEIFRDTGKKLGLI